MPSPKCLSDEDLGRLCEGDVSLTQRRVYEEHLESCAECRARWQRVSAGAQHVEATLSRTVQAAPGTPCPSQDVVARYLSGMLGPAEKDAVDEHLIRCATCREEILLTAHLSEEYTEEGRSWWSQYVAQQVFGLVAKVPGEADNLVKALQKQTVSRVLSREVVELPALQPRESGRLRLAAATGEGFTEQTLRQEEPPFEFHLAKFGQLLRITARPVGPDSPYGECLARLEILEADVCRWSRMVLVSSGECQCNLGAEDVGKLQPEKAPLILKLTPLVSAEQLDAAGPEAYVPILERLLKHRDPSIRRGAVQVLSRIAGPSGRSLVEPLTGDPDEAVRSEVEKALRAMQPR